MTDLIKLSKEQHEYLENGGRLVIRLVDTDYRLEPAIQEKTVAITYSEICECGPIGGRL